MDHPKGYLMKQRPSLDMLGKAAEFFAFLISANNNDQIVSMRAEANSIDGNPLFRYLHLHCFTHMYRVLTALSPKDYFKTPRFPLFKRIERLYHSNEKHQLFYNLIFTYLRQIIVAIIITIIGASLNLLVPELIRQFMHFMREKHLKQKQYGDFISKFVIIQLLRIFFAEHSKRLFHELAIKVQSTLARKLISKSLRMAKECRDCLPQSEIIQLQNVDLKLIFTLFRNMNIIFQAPFTIVVALVLLFKENSHYGFIGGYWFLIAFLIQRQLDGRMMHCNQTKLKLIERRSNLNYDLFFKIKEAKLIGWEDLIIEKNNNLFILENHDHSQFYTYSTLYDISLLMLPIFVVSTITLYDINEEDPITVEQVYLMLSLLGICYNPMKSVRNISINLHDGLISLQRLSKYFHLPEQIKSTLIQTSQGSLGQIEIAEGTQATHPHLSDIKTMQFLISVQPGERLIILGKQNSGCSSFLQMLVGNLKRIRGKVYINGKISYLPEKLFFLKDTVMENIRFLNNQITTSQIQEIYNQLGLSHDLRFNQDMHTIMDDTNKFTRSVLKKIALARVLISNADIYILDSPFSQIEDEIIQVVEKRLKDLQQRGKTIVITYKHLISCQSQYQLLILQAGEVKEYAKFRDLIHHVESRLSLFLKKREDGRQFLEPKTGILELKFHERSRSFVNFDLKSATLFKKSNFKGKTINAPIISRLAIMQENLKEKITNSNNFERLVLKFLSSVSFKQTIYIFIIILAAQVLHIFIHFYIGHLEEEYGNAGYHKFKNLMITEIILTFCLAGLIYLEGQISTILAIVIGNKLYEESINQLTNKKLYWFSNQYSVELADKYNHDYEEIFIACHSIFGIYKNLVILIATIQFISTNRSKLIAIFIVLSSIYYSIFYLFRKIQRKIVKHYYDYKYNYVKALEQSIKGAEQFRIFGLKNEVIKRAEEKYSGLASYKLSESYYSYALSLICDILSISLLTIGIEYGIQMKIHHRQQKISIIATSIFLLMNISEVLKTIIREVLNFESFFCINLIPFMEIGDRIIKRDDETDIIHSELSKGPANFVGHRIQFENLVLEWPNQKLKSSHSFSLVIEEGQTILLYEKDNRYRDLLLYALTNNLDMLDQPNSHRIKRSTIKIGGVSIRDATKKQWHSMIGVLATENFYFRATIRQNVTWGLQSYNKSKVQYYTDLLKLQKEFPWHQKDILSTVLNSRQHKIRNSLIKKIALLRILLKQPKVVILKDLDEYLDFFSIADVLRKEIANVTIVKINNLIESSLDATRIIAMENLKIIEEGHPKQIQEHSKTKLGDELRDINIASYTLRKRASSTKKRQLSLF